MPKPEPNQTMASLILTELADVIGGIEMQNILDRAIAATEPVVAVDALPTEDVVEEE